MNNGENETHLPDYRDYTNQPLIPRSSAAELFSEYTASQEEAATKVLVKLNLGTPGDINKLTTFLPHSYNKESFIKECLNILIKPPPEALNYFRRFFLNLYMANLIALKLINQVGKNVLASDPAFTLERRLIEDLIPIEFSLTEDDTQPVITLLKSTTFYQKNLFALTIKPSILIGKVIAAQKLEKLERNRQLLHLARNFLSVSHSFKLLIIELNKYPVVEDWRLMIPDRLQYAFALISETKGIFNNGLIHESLSMIEVEDDPESQQTIEDQFFGSLRYSLTRIISLLQAVVDKRALDQTILDEFGFSINEDKAVQAQQQSQNDNHEFINKSLLCNFINGMINQSNKSELIQSMLSLDYMMIGMQYCYDYDAHNAAQEERLTKLSEGLCGKPNSPINKPCQKPKARSHAASNDDEKKPSATQLKSKRHSSNKQYKIDDEYKSVTPIIHDPDLEKFPRLRCQLEIGHQVLEQRLVDANKKYRGLEQHALLQKKGKTDKPLYPDFKHILDEVSEYVKVIEEILKLSSYSKDNFEKVTQALNKLPAEQTKLERLRDSLGSATRYFIGAKVTLFCTHTTTPTRASSQNPRRNRLG